jgi:hypothetical protein
MEDVHIHCVGDHLYARAGDSEPPANRLRNVLTDRHDPCPGHGRTDGVTGLEQQLFRSGQARIAEPGGWFVVCAMYRAYRRASRQTSGEAARQAGSIEVCVDDVWLVCRKPGAQLQNSAAEVPVIGHAQTDLFDVEAPECVCVIASHGKQRVHVHPETLPVQESCRVHQQAFGPSAPQGFDDHRNPNHRVLAAAS